MGRVETGFETEKSDVGFDEYEMRTWADWHHHVALSRQQAWREKDDAVSLGDCQQGFNEDPQEPGVRIGRCWRVPPRGHRAPGAALGLVRPSRSWRAPVGPVGGVARQGRRSCRPWSPPRGPHGPACRGCLPSGAFGGPISRAGYQLPTPLGRVMAMAG